MRTMKWHIFNGKNRPLCVDEQAVEFDTKADAISFLKSCNALPEDPEDTNQEIYIQECILYYDGGHINLTGKTAADCFLEGE